MSAEDIEKWIRQNVSWSDLPHEVQREYDKRILDYSIRNQLRHKTNIVRLVKKDPEEYYDLLLKESRNKLMLFPYHLSEYVVGGLRITPFQYYVSMVEDIMKAEKSYDSLPNFTAADAMRLLGIGRNQYIEMMNQTRSFKKLFRRGKGIHEVLPQSPVEISLESFWMARAGCVLDSDIKLLDAVEKDIIDKLVEGFPLVCGLLDKKAVLSLFSRGLVYFDVPVSNDDYVYVPTLDGFVMNRVQGDYFENLLYKVFVTLDGQMSVKELADVIDIDLESVKTAISVFLRLGFARKRSTGLEQVQLHKSWKPHDLAGDGPILLSNSVMELTNDDDEFDSSLEESRRLSTVSITPSPSVQSTPLSEVAPSVNKRMAFVFDSSLTAFLMMGNLSAKLKNHAVTLFEVGKLSDETVDNFVDELSNINFFAEGEAQRYSEHARTLLNTIKALKGKSELDLIRGESLLSLDQRARDRVVKKSYSLMVTMGPLLPDACAFHDPVVPLLGIPIVETASYWLRLFIYAQAAAGPPSLLLPMGFCLKALPHALSDSTRVILTSSSHEPNILLSGSVLSAVNEALPNTPTFMQAYSRVVDDSEIVNVPFPFIESERQDPNHLCNHPTVSKLKGTVQWDLNCGYLVFLRKCDAEDEDVTQLSVDSEKCDSIPSPTATLRSNFNNTVTKDPRKVSSSRKRTVSPQHGFDEYVLFDCVFGIPLFDEQLNHEVTQRVTFSDLFQKGDAILKENVTLTNKMHEFVKTLQCPGYQNPFGLMDSNFIPLPTQPVFFDGRSIQPISFHTHN